MNPTAHTAGPRPHANRWQARWAGLAPQERRGISAAIALVVCAAVWLGIVSPGLQQWRTAEAKGRALDAQLQQMQTWQAQAQAIQAQPALGHDEAVRALTAATQQILETHAKVSVVGERATVTLQNAQPQALAQWLAQVRLNARVAPSEAHLTRTPGPGPSLWNGTLTMALPAK